MTKLSISDREILITRIDDFRGQELFSFISGYVYAKTGLEHDGLDDNVRKLRDEDLICLARYLTENYHLNEFMGLTPVRQWEEIQSWDVSGSVGKEASSALDSIPGATCLLKLRNWGLQIVNNAGSTLASASELAKVCKCDSCAFLRTTR